MSTVLKAWVCELPWKQQSVLLSGLRGPDGIHCPQIKIVTRWLRNVTQNNADPMHSYMNVGILPTFEQLEKELEYCTAHYVHHLTQALKVIEIGCEVDDPDACQYARQLNREIANELFHLWPESDTMFINRLADKVEHE
jgi:hypothetical protein